LLRALAELQNVQRRRRQEMDQALAYAHEPLVRALLPVLDDLERALAATQGREEDPLAAGVRIVLDQLRGTLERDGLEAIRPANGSFDPQLHDALMQRPGPGMPPHTVLEVVKPGYRYRGRVLRHAQVVVSEDAAPGPEALPPDGAASAEEPGASKPAKEGLS
jgi:molecular chaperone GrpE